MAVVAANVRALRANRGLTLAQLSARSGVAKSTLAQIESGSTNPTLGTLAALADALASRPEELLVAPQRDPAVRVIRRGEGADLSDHAVGAELVDAFTLAASTAEFHRLHLRNGRTEVSASHGLNSREHVLVLNGSARIGPKGNEEIVHAGDYAIYRSDAPHVWEATEGADAEIWVLAIYPVPTA